MPGASGYLDKDVQCTPYLETAIGFTTSNPNGFSNVAHLRQFALCSGAAAVVYEVGHNGAISHRIFRADPFSSAESISHIKGNPASSVAPLDSSKRRQSTLRLSNVNSSPRSPISTFHNDSHPHASPSKSKTISRNRIATCVALSLDGQLLAVGEVSFWTSPTCPSDLKCLAFLCLLADLHLPFRSYLGSLHPPINKGLSY